MADYISMTEADARYGKRGVSNTALGIGIGGLALAALNGNGNGILGGLFGGNSGTACGGPTAWEAWQKECEDNVALTSAIWQTRVTDLQEKFDLYTRLDNKISELEKSDATLKASLPLMFQLANVTSERYTDDKVCANREKQNSINAAMEAQILMRPAGDVRLNMSSLYTGIPTLPNVRYVTETCPCPGTSTVG